MADIVDPSTRSRIMSRVKSGNTRPEMAVRRGLHGAGFRFRLHRKDLPGRPDVVLPKYRAVIFIHGCFWHGHGCGIFKMPETRREFWQEKIGKNVLRDRDAISRLEDMNWRVGIVWECSLRGPGRIGIETVIRRLSMWLRSDEAEIDISENEGARR